VHLLDVGGASGTWTIAFLRSQPDAVATLFDLEHVIPLAEQPIAEARMNDRVRLVGGDFLVDPIPQGADLAWVSVIVHQNSREEMSTVKRRSHVRSSSALCRRAPSSHPSLRRSSLLAVDIALEKEKGRSDHDKKESKVCEWEDPPTTAIDAISDLGFAMLIERADHQVDHDRGAHREEAEVHEAVRQCEVGDAGLNIARQHLIGNGGQDPDERDTDPIALFLSIHPDHRERE